MRLEFFKKYEYKKFIKQQSKMTFDGIHKSYENCDSFSLKQNEVNIDKPNCLGFAALKISKLHKYETYYDKIQPYFGQENFQLKYVDTNAYVLSMNTKDIIKDLKH